MEELTTSNESELFALMRANKEEYHSLVSGEEIPNTHKVFHSKLNTWFEFGRIHQFMVRNNSKMVIGTVFLYGLSDNGTSVKCSCFFAPEMRKKPLVAESIGLTIIFAYNIMKVKSMVFEVYENNIPMQRIATRLHAASLGKFDSYTNEEKKFFRYKLDENQIIQIVNKINKLERTTSSK